MFVVFMMGAINSISSSIFGRPLHSKIVYQRNYVAWLAVVAVVVAVIVHFEDLT